MGTVALIAIIWGGLIVAAVLTLALLSPKQH
jgi:hypothetical protein